MSDYVSKVKVDEKTYDLKDILARQDMQNLVNAKNPVILNSFIMEGSKATGIKAVAVGNNTTASGHYSMSEGSDTLAKGVNSHAEGDTTTAAGDNSHAEGKETAANGESSHAEGANTTADGLHSHAEGCETEAKGHASHAEGCSNSAAASYSHVEGSGNKVLSTTDEDGKFETGVAAHVEGGSNESSASYSHVEGFNNKVGEDAKYVHVSGIGNEAYYPNNKIIIGQYNKNGDENIFEFGNGYIDPGDANHNESTVRQNALTITKDNKMFVYLNDIIFMAPVGGDLKPFSVADAVLIDSELNMSSNRPVQNKVLTEKLNEVFQSVSEGKKLLASALTEKKVPASMDMTFEELANAIASIDTSRVIDDRYLFVRDNAYVSNEGQGIAMPITKVDGDFINFFDYTILE